VGLLRSVVARRAQDLFVLPSPALFYNWRGAAPRNNRGSLEPSMPIRHPVRAALVLAVAVASGCGGQRASPLAPVQPIPSDTLTLAGDAVWFDPAGTSFLLDMNHESRLIEISGSTSFVGALPSVDAMRVAYETGHRLSVVARGPGYSTGSWPGRVSAFSVDAEARDTFLAPFGGDSRGRVLVSDPQFWSFSLNTSYRSAVCFTPSTIFDPSGDFTTFDDLVAGMARGDVGQVSGEGWYVATVWQNARTIKATRGPH